MKFLRGVNGSISKGFDLFSNNKFPVLVRDGNLNTGLSLTISCFESAPLGNIKKKK